MDPFLYYSTIIYSKVKHPLSEDNSSFHIGHLSQSKYKVFLRKSHPLFLYTLSLLPCLTQCKNGWYAHVLICDATQLTFISWLLRDKWSVVSCNNEVVSCNNEGKKGTTIIPQFLMKSSVGSKE